MTLESGEDVATSTLELSVQEEEEGRRSWYLTVPNAVKRGGRLVCQTNKTFLNLQPRDVMNSPSSSLNFTLTTDARVAQPFKLTVTLEDSLEKWEMISDTR